MTTAKAGESIVGLAPSEQGRSSGIAGSQRLVQRIDQNTAICINPVFIVGAPRSGTTALGRALSNHSDFWTSEETHILYWLFGNGRLADEFDRWKTRRASPTWFQAQDVGWEEFLEHLGLGFNALFTGRSWGRRWVDHTPYYVLMIDVLAPMFPGARFVHILRDGRSVVHSMINVAVTLADRERDQMRSGDFLPEWTNDFREACKTWRTCAEAALSASSRYTDRCLTIRHDRLSADAHESFRAILAFLEADYEPRPANYWRSNRINSSFNRGAGSTQIEGARSWAKWTRDERRTFVEECGELLIALGFASKRDLRIDSKA